MENSRGRRVDKRGYEQSVEDEDNHLPDPKKAKMPALASVIVEALKVDSLQRLCSSLEPLFRRIVSEEVERALTRMGHAQLAAMSPPKIQGPEGKNLQLHFRTRMPPHLFTGGKVEGEQGAAIHVVLIDASTGSVVQTGPESGAKLNIVVLEGDFNEEAEEDWTLEHFESHEVKEREGKRPLLTGDLQVLVDSSVKRAYENWHQVIEYDGKVLNSLTNAKNGKRALVAPIVDNYETNHYISSNQNRQQPYISSEPGPQSQAVNNHPSVPQLIEFPFVRSDNNAIMTVNNPQGGLAGGMDHMSVGTPGVGGSYFSGDWSRPRNGQGVEDFFTEEIRLRSSEMLEHDDMQRLLKSFGIGSGFGHSDEACYSYSIQAYEPQIDQAYTQGRGRGSGKAVVGWLKLKAALRWGIFIRKKAAERRAQLVELD
ncbi:calmodulin binding protein, putative [Ricinus communis]|uniref:Calmodulin binding protein, putative n=1 Tax=Ricinus communis TaxID=3988 RepID=B9SBZ0_RICCO|nr:calmodulin binding protein, putative [Ricinus communis]